MKIIFEGTEEQIKNLKLLIEHGDNDLPKIEEDNLCPDNFEWTEGGDGVEFEYWENTDTGEIFHIDIEIVRDFNNACPLED